MQRHFLLLALVFLLAACGAPAVETPTPPASPTWINTATLMPSSTATERPKATVTATLAATDVPKNEVVNYGVCAPEKYKDCVIPPDDLFNGKYEAYLNTLSKPFDPSKFKNPMPTMQLMDNGAMIYNPDTSPNFNDHDSAPFRRNVTAGYTTAGKHKFLVLPIEYADMEDPTNKDKNVWVIGVVPLYRESKNLYVQGGSVIEAIKDWENKMNIAPLVTSPVSVNTYETNPLVDQTFAAHPDGGSDPSNPGMSERFQQFMNGKASALKGMVLNLSILRFQNKHWYE
jgi:hypothetical protein